MPCPPDVPQTLCNLRPKLLRLALHLTGNRDQAQDLCQEVLLKIWTRLQKRVEIEDLRAYAMTALRNQYRQHLRAELPQEELTEVDAVTTPDVFAVLAIHDLETAIRGLNAPQARLMRLIAQGETSPAALAQVTGWPLGTVMSRLARARAKLRLKVGLGENSPTADLF